MLTIDGLTLSKVDSDLLEPEEEIVLVTSGPVYSLGKGPGAAIASAITVTDRRLVLAFAFGGDIVGKIEILFSSVISVGVLHFAGQPHLHLSEPDCQWWFAADVHDVEELSTLVKGFVYERS